MTHLQPMAPLTEYGPHPVATIRALATTTPAVRQSQAALADELARLWDLRGAGLARWRRIIHGTEIESRAAVAPIREMVRLSTGERMRLYEEHAPALAESSARDAIGRSGISAGEVTDVIVVSCTGFSAPGVDVDLVDRLGLTPSVRRTVVGFMGCFGAVIGLRTALGICATDPAAVVLLVCVELCSLHVRPTPDMANQVASALFADGAAAVVLSGAVSETDDDTADPPPGVSGLRLTGLGRSRLAPGTRGAMSWRITDAGFAMTLSATVPGALADELRDVTLSDGGRAALVVHPGGAAIIDAIEAATGPERTGDLDAARAVMRDHGNMSSPSVLFVLERIAASRPIAGATLAAFGPGLSVDTIQLTRS